MRERVCRRVYIQDARVVKNGKRVTSRERKGKDEKKKSCCGYCRREYPGNDLLIRWWLATRVTSMEENHVVVRTAKKTFTLKHLNTNIQFNLSDWTLARSRQRSNSSPRLEQRVSSIPISIVDQRSTTIRNLYIRTSYIVKFLTLTELVGMIHNRYIHQTFSLFFIYCLYVHLRSLHAIHRPIFFFHLLPLCNLNLSYLWYS